MRASKFVILGIYLFIKNWSYSLSFCCGCNFIPPESNRHSYTLPLGKEREKLKRKGTFAIRKASLFGGHVVCLPVRFATRRRHQISLQYGNVIREDHLMLQYGTVSLSASGGGQSAGTSESLSVTVPAVTLFTPLAHAGS